MDGCPVVLDRHRHVDRLLAQADRADDDVPDLREVPVGVGLEDASAALAADAEPDERATTGRADERFHLQPPFVEITRPPPPQAPTAAELSGRQARHRRLEAS